MNYNFLEHITVLIVLHICELSFCSLILSKEGMPGNLP